MVNFYTQILNPIRTLTASHEVREEKGMKWKNEIYLSLNMELQVRRWSSPSVFSPENREEWRKLEGTERDSHLRKEEVRNRHPKEHSSKTP